VSSTPAGRLSRGVDSVGAFGRFAATVIGDAVRLRALRFPGEVLRQAGILIAGSTLVIAGLMFIIGTTCGIEGAFFARTTGASSYAGLITAWCDLREAAPYAFGYMMAAKVGTGLVAEIGAMRVSEEVDALEVMGLDSVAFLCSTRLLASWLVIPPIYIIGVLAAFLASYIVVVLQIGDTSAGGYNLIFWFFQSPLDLLFSLIKGVAMATLIVIVGTYYGFTASGGSVGVGAAAAKSMVVNVVGVHLIGMLSTFAFWGTNPRAPIGG